MYLCLAPARNIVAPAARITPNLSSSPFVTPPRARAGSEINSNGELSVQNTPHKLDPWKQDSLKPTDHGKYAIWLFSEIACSPQHEIRRKSQKKGCL